MSTTDIEEFPEICKKYEFETIPLTDYQSLSQCVAYHRAMTEAGLKPILGFSTDKSVFYAKNKEGWRQLLTLFKEGWSKKGFSIEDKIAPDCVIKVDFNDQRYDSSKNLIKSEEKKQAYNILRCLHDKCKLDKLPDFDKRVIFSKPSDIDIVKNHKDLFAQIEPFEIENAPLLPKLGDEDQNTQLARICRSSAKFDSNNQVYSDRLGYELKTIQDAGMSGYFLIFWDMLKWIRSQGELIGAARGSAGGSLVAYLSDITQVDPIEYGLIFERFYAPGRGGLPDIDIDIPPLFRPSIIKYLAGKYGNDNIAQLSTYGRLKGSAAIKACLRVNDKNVSFGEQNDISNLIPDETVISGSLIKQKKELGSSSTVLWALKHSPNSVHLSSWCTIEDGVYSGIYADDFRLAVELDNTIQNKGKHASAFALTNKPIYNYAPMEFDPISNRFIVSVDMHAAESLGLVKLDLLGIDLLSKCKTMMKILAGEE